MAEKTIEIGYDDVLIIDKLFGPTIFANLKIVPDFERGAWIIYRQWVRTGAWVEWATIPAQVEPEFTDPESHAGLTEAELARLQKLEDDRDRLVQLRQRREALQTASHIAQIAALRDADVDWPEVAAACGVDPALLAQALGMSADELDAFIDDRRAQADLGVSNTKAIIAAVNDLGDAVVTALTGGEAKADSEAPAAPTCNCECHREGQRVMHAFPCCDRAGEQYLDENGKPR
jgi:hypothetical protein